MLSRDWEVLLQAEREADGHGDLALKYYLGLCWPELMVWEKCTLELPPPPDMPPNPLWLTELLPPELSLLPLLPLW